MRAAALTLGSAVLYGAAFPPLGAAPLAWLALAPAWTAAELARARLLLANPWALLAYALPARSALAQTADVAGPYGAGWLLAASSAAVAAFAMRRSRATRMAAPVAILVVAAAVYGEWRLRAPAEAGEPLRVAVVQGNVTPTFRERAPDPDASVARHVALTKAAAARHPALVVWPEYAVDVHLQEPSSARDAVLATSRDLGAAIAIDASTHDAAGAAAADLGARPSTAIRGREAPVDVFVLPLAER